MKNFLVNNAILNGIVKEINGLFIINCPVCLKERTLKTRKNIRRALKCKTRCNSCSNGIKTKGRKTSFNTKKKMSASHIKRYTDVRQKYKTSELVKKAMYRPDVRKRHIEALHNSKWLKVKTDKGQLELIEKWNRLGFNFQPNYQIKTGEDLFYLDGYDLNKNVVLEYDSKYHFRLKQYKKDIVRQNKIIQWLNPKFFWRYDVVNKKYTLVYRNNN